MEDGRQQAQWRRRRPLLESHPRRARDLSSLMQEDWFLQMVLEHVVDYGLHNCRLVCWKWYELCQQFPIKLTRVGNDQLEEAVDAFPHAVSLSIKDCCSSPISDHIFFELISPLTSLNSLELATNVISVTGALQQHIGLIPGLKRLDLKIRYPHFDAESFSFLRHLTELTKLKLTGGAWEFKQIYPFTELQTICELEIEFFLFSDLEGNCHFPSLTNLTRLELHHEFYFVEDADEDVIVTTEAVNVHASSLQCLNLMIHSGYLEFDCVPLNALTGLKTLRVLHGCILFERQGHVETPTVVFSSLLPRLKALELTSAILPEYVAEDLPLLPTITQVTALSVLVEEELIPELCCLTLLVDLKLTVLTYGIRSLDDVLSWMPHLQNLDVIKFEDTGSLTLSGNALTDMSRLESVSLNMIDVNKDFFSQLSAKTQLKTLEFSHLKTKIYPHSFLSQINWLESLEELKLNLAEQCLVCEILSPHHLSKLKKVTVECSEQQEEILRRRFACCRGVLINHKESPWLSRLSL